MPTARTRYPHLLRPQIVAMLQPLAELARNEAFLKRLGPVELIEVLDLVSTLTVARDAQTILFSSAQALALKPALDRFAEDLREYRLPFPATLIQFSEPIGESQLLPYPEEVQGLPKPHPGEDKILALLLSQSENNQGQLINGAGAWFQSRAVSRVTWVNADNAHLRMLDFGEPDARQRLANKEMLRNLAIACIAYINCENITLERQAADARLNRSRSGKGKKPFEDYYLCHLRPGKGEAGAGEMQGSGHGFRYDVRAHFRRLPDGRLTWVRAHQRGVGHELYKPKVYRVE